MEHKSYFQRIEEKIAEQEKTLGRKLTLDEQDEQKFLAMQELWIALETTLEEEAP